MMKVLITGSSGFIGGCLSEKLSKSCEVVGLDLRRGPYTNVVGDIRDFGLIKKHVRNVDVIVHCAAQVSVIKSIKDPLLDAETNIIGTLNLLEAVRRSHRLRKFVYISSAAVYGFPKYVPIDEDHPKEPISPYGLSKLAGELYTRIFNRLYGVPTVCVRPFNVYGEHQGLTPHSDVISEFLYQIRRDSPPIIYGDGMQTRDFVHVQDVVDMVALVMEREEAIGETFNCGTGREVSINELARLMISLSSKSLRPKYSEGKVGDINRSCANIRKAEKVLGFKPKISLEEGLKELILTKSFRDYSKIEN